MRHNAIGSSGAAMLEAMGESALQPQQQTEPRRRKRGGRGRNRNGQEPRSHDPQTRQPMARWVEPRPAKTQLRERQPQPRPLPQSVRRGPPPISQLALAPLGRLVIVTDTDLPCSTNVAVCVPGDHAGLKCAYLDSELYNHFGWWWEPPKAFGEAGGVADISQFGMRLDVFPRKDGGAWRFQTAPVTQKAARFETRVDVKGGRKGIGWSPRDVGISVLHIRWKGEIEAWLEEQQKGGAK